MSVKNEIAIWQRIIQPSWTTLPSIAAKGILRLKFDKADIAKMKALSTRASEGTLTGSQRGELESYLRVGRMLAIMHSNARRSLKGKPDQLSAPRRKVS